MKTPTTAAAPAAAWADSGGTPVPNATVELYSSAGVYITSTTTSATGGYTFTGQAAGNYFVRVVSSSVASQRSGSTGALRGVLTWRSNASSGNAVSVTDEVGGTNPAATDPAAGSAGAAFNTATKVFSAVLTGTAQAVAPVTLGASPVGGVDFGFSFSTVVNTNDSGAGSLRQVITNANALGNDAALAQAGRTAGIEHVVFMISNGSNAAGLRSSQNAFSGGVATISPTSALPTVSSPLVLDAQTQPGWTLAPMVELDGTSAGAGVTGLTLGGAGCVLRGFVINRFHNDGLVGLNVSGLEIQGNYIGTTSSGNTAAANLQRGMYLSGGSNHVVGGSAAAQGNVVSGNGTRGITIAGGTGHSVQGNRIGVGADGSTLLANGGFGLLLQAGASSSTIGGTAAGAANLIRGNTRGIQIDVGSSGVNISANAIYGNSGLGISLGAPAPNLNDGAQSAGQANLQTDSPVFTAASLVGTTLNVSGYVGSAANQATFGGARVEVFVSDKHRQRLRRGPSLHRRTDHRRQRQLQRHAGRARRRDGHHRQHAADRHRHRRQRQHQRVRRQLPGAGLQHQRHGVRRPELRRRRRPAQGIGQRLGRRQQWRQPGHAGAVRRHRHPAGQHQRRGRWQLQLCQPGRRQLPGATGHRQCAVQPQRLGRQRQNPC